MNPRASNRLPLLLLGTVIAVVGAAVSFSVFAANSLPAGPVDLVWDKTACASCRMHVGEPAFSAQLTTKDGRTHAFDDPGCLFVFLDEEQPAVHEIWFHHLHELRWLPASAVAFVPVEPTPMGFGLGAVDPGTPGAIDLGAARQRCVEHASSKRGGR